MSNIEKVFEIFENHRERFENTMNAGLSYIAFGYLLACQALLTAADIFEPDAVEVDQMTCAQDAMQRWFFGEE